MSDERKPLVDPGCYLELPASPQAWGKVNARIAQLQEIRKNYLAYQEDRVAERDHHGAWDVAINLSETECEIAGLVFALEAITGKEP